MKNSIQKIVLLLVLIVAMHGCRKKAFDDYYGRPSNLAQPIYQQLQARGNFKNLLACIDKGGYKSILASSGYFTFFAANDSAFGVFFKERGINSVTDIDSATAQKIVTYNLVYNAFMKARLGDFQSNAGWVANGAFKRRTTNYVGFYDSSVNGQTVPLLNANLNGGYVANDNNNKYIPYFVDNYVTARGLSAYDYNYFYPNTTYTGFNVVDAKVVNQDIIAENGYVHEIDKVILPLPSIDYYMGANPNYSEFKKLYDKYMVTLVQNAAATTKYQILYNSTKNAFIKSYSSALPFSPNNENYLTGQTNYGQTDGWTLFAPKNEVLLAYINNVLLEKYTSLDAMPQQIIIDFLSAHMFQKTVWPSKFKSTTNTTNEEARFDPAKDVVDKKILSNGFFYGTSKVQEADVFRTVYGKAYLDPSYLLMTKALDLGLRLPITIPNFKYTVFMMSDSLLKSFGYDYSLAQNAWQYTDPTTGNVSYGNGPRDRLLRILGTHIVYTPKGELNDLSESGIIETYRGEYIKYNAGTVVAGGNLDNGTKLTVSSSKAAVNGKVYYGDNLFLFSELPIFKHVENLVTSGNNDYNYFYQYLLNSALRNTTTNELSGILPGALYTLFVPNNAAMKKAVNDGFLPGTGIAPNMTPNFNPTSATDRALVNKFIQFHFLSGITVAAPDANKVGLSYQTLLKKLSADPTLIRVDASANNTTLQLTDNFNRIANVIAAKSNNLSNRCLIHLIDNYLQYNEQ